MHFITSDELAAHIDSFIHQKTQQHSNHFDLTVSNIFRLSHSGSLDFGGGEFEEAKKENITPQKRNNSDDYGWWELSEGTYYAIMNEELNPPEEAVPLLTLHPHANKAGLMAGKSVIGNSSADNKIEMAFRVPETGCNIKENARLATLYLLAG